MKGIKILLLSIITIFVIVLYFYEKRSFYYSVDKEKCITVWKMLGGKCLIIPGKYMGLMKPDTEYLETVNNNALIIIWSKEIVEDFIVLNAYGLPVNLNFKSHKVSYYNSSERDIFNKTYYFDKKIKPGFEYLAIDIKENSVMLNGQKM